MKKESLLTTLLLCALLLLSGCGTKTTKPVTQEETVAQNDSIASEEPLPAPSTDEIIEKAIAEYLKGNEEAVRFTERARQDLDESSWPEVQCSVEGLLDSPASFKDLTVKKVGDGLYKYECTCPKHGDKFVDFTTISASIDRDGVVVITGVKWEEAVE